MSPCCERDTDGDGNCPIHSAPGVLRQAATRDCIEVDGVTYTFTSREGVAHRANEPSRPLSSTELSLCKAVRGARKSRDEARRPSPDVTDAMVEAALHAWIEEPEGRDNQTWIPQHDAEDMRRALEAALAAKDGR